MRSCVLCMCASYIASLIQQITSRIGNRVSCAQQCTECDKTTPKQSIRHIPHSQDAPYPTHSLLDTYSTLYTNSVDKLYSNRHVDLTTVLIRTTATITILQQQTNPDISVDKPLQTGGDIRSSTLLVVVERFSPARFEKGSVSPQ